MGCILGVLGNTVYLAGYRDSNPRSCDRTQVCLNLSNILYTTVQYVVLRKINFDIFPTVHIKAS